MTNNDLGDMIHDKNGIPINVGFSIQCLKGVKFSNYEDRKIFCVGRMVETIHFETADLHNGDESPFLLKAWYQAQGGTMQYLLRYFSLDDLETMMTHKRFVALLEKMEIDFGIIVL